MKVSRDPMWWINCRAGIRTDDNPGGLAAWWTGPDAVTQLIEQCREGYGHGARRFFLNRPHGTDGRGDVSAASWLTIPAWKREPMAEAIRAMEMGTAFGEPCEVIPFIGSGMVAPDAYTGWNPGDPGDGHLIGQRLTNEQRIASAVTLGGWLSCGVSGIAIDHSGPENERWFFVALAHALRTAHGVEVYGEAWPPLEVNGETVIDFRVSRVMPWIQTERVLKERPWCGPVDPDATRLFVWYDRRRSSYDGTDWLGMMDEHARRGYLAITNHPGMFARAMRYARGEQ